jgi:hypothetical protein
MVLVHGERRAIRRWIVWCAVLWVAACDGSDDGVSAGGDFLGVFTAAAVGLGAPYEPAIPVYRDQVLLFSFEGAIDPAPFGGYVQQGGQAQIFLGRTPGLLTIPYRAFADQAAARAALVVSANIASGQQISYIVGVALDDPNSLVLDPRIDPAYGLALGAAPGYPTGTATEYVFRIPGDSALRAGGGRPSAVGVAAGASLPVSLQPGGPGTPTVGFTVVDAYVPDPTPPEVLSITPLSGVVGDATSPMAATDGFLIRFSRRVTAASLAPTSNVVLRNLDVAVGSTPVVLQASLTPYDVYAGGPCDPLSVAGSSEAYCLLPSPDLGPGVGPNEGYDVEVRVGSFGNSSLAPIRGDDLGATAGPPLANSLAASFKTAPCPSCATVSKSVLETFTATTFFDPSFAGTFGTGRWNSGSASGVLTGRPIAGSALGTDPSSLGTRLQILVDPQPLGVTPPGLFSPFDASLAATTACGQNCGSSGCNLGVNPGGGSHIMHLFESSEFNDTRDALELVEWAPVGGVTVGTTYPAMSIWAGLTGLNAPLSGTLPPSPFNPGLLSAYGVNYGAQATGLAGTTLLPFQSSEPSIFEVTPVAQGGNNVNGRVRVFGAAAYTVQSAASTFYPYPLFTTPFDFSTVATTTTPHGNLVLEMNVETGTQCANFHRYRATAIAPVRRIIGVPLSQVPTGNTQIAAAGGFDVYRLRFTFVGRRSSVRSLWYDTTSAAPTYVGFTTTPSAVPGVVGGQPAGTRSRWTLEGFSGVVPPSASTVPSFSGTGIDEAGVLQSAALTGMTNAGCRYFRFRVDLMANTATNELPSFDTVQVLFQ